MRFGFIIEETAQQGDDGFVIVLFLSSIDAVHEKPIEIFY